MQSKQGLQLNTSDCDAELRFALGKTRLPKKITAAGNFPHGLFLANPLNSVVCERTRGGWLKKIRQPLFGVLGNHIHGLTLASVVQLQSELNQSRPACLTDLAEGSAESTVGGVQELRVVKGVK